MKAVICPRYGPPEVLKITEVAKPVPRDNEILVKIRATTVTVGDTRMRGFKVPPMFWLPGRLALGIRKPRIAILGAELAGDVAAVGKDVTRFKAGDAVFAFTSHDVGGAYAEYCCVPDNDMIVLKPAHMTYEEAATLPAGGLTALDFLKEGHIQAGQKVLIVGASGSVGTYAVQLAKHFGADVTGVCSGANVALVQSLGADHVIDYTQDDFTRNGARYDIIFDTVGTTTFGQVNHSLKPRGFYLHAVMPFDSFKRPWYALTTGKQVRGGIPPKQPDVLEYLKGLVETGAIKPVIDRTYPLEDIVEAHRYVDTGRKKGNVVITVV